MCPLSCAASRTPTSNFRSEHEKTPAGVFFLGAALAVRGSLRVGEGVRSGDQHACTLVGKCYYAILLLKHFDTMLRQRTLKNTIRATGIGLHSGNKVYLTLKPGEIDGGIRFRRTDVNPPVEIPANALLVNDTVMSTNLVKDGVKVGTVQHLM